MPLALPFLLAASAFLILAAGSRSGWRTSAEYAADQRAPGAKVEGAPGLKRWFFWYVLPFGGKQYGARGPENLTDAEAWELERQTVAASLGAQLFRFVWVPARGVWVYDTRNPPSLLASRDIVDAAGNVVGAVSYTKPKRGPWPFRDLPQVVHLGGRRFERARFSAAKVGVVGQYREAKDTNAEHLYVLRDGTYCVDHYDEANPDRGQALAHFVKDVLPSLRVA